MPRHLNSKWVVGAHNDEERDAIEKEVRRSKQVLDRLATILERDIAELEATSKKDYEIANWPYWRADLDGQLRVLRELVKLVTIKPKDDPNE